jgi:hypothetical protein
MGAEDLFQEFEPLLSSQCSHVFFQVLIFGRPLEEVDFLSSTQGASKQVSAYVFEKDKPFLDNLRQITEWSEQHSGFVSSVAADLDYLPLFALASRHYQIPLPLQLVQIFLDGKDKLD